MGKPSPLQQERRHLPTLEIINQRLCNSWCNSESTMPCLLPWVLNLQGAQKPWSSPCCNHYSPCHYDFHSRTQHSHTHTAIHTCMIHVGKVLPPAGTRVSFLFLQVLGVAKKRTDTPTNKQTNKQANKQTWYWGSFFFLATHNTGSFF